MGSASAPAVVCPEDGEPLAAASGRLRCARGHEWRTDKGIPRMLPGAHTYADAFGLQWNVYRKTQLDSYTRTTISLDRARRCLGEDAWSLLHHADTDVLEVGCGAGRFTEVLLAAGARVTSVDLSSAVEANQENFPQNERHRVLQAEVMRLPFAPRQYDIVFCLGVIQHTPSPEATIATLYEQVRPGGWLVIDHYAYNLSSFTKISAWLVRSVVHRMSPERGLRWTERLVSVFFPLHRGFRHSHFANAIFARISPISSYFHTYPLNDELQRQWSLLDTHDWLTDWYKHYRTKGQIRRTLEGLGVVDLTCEAGGNGIEARCRRG